MRSKQAVIDRNEETTEWLRTIDTLFTDIEAWSRTRGWVTSRSESDKDEAELGSYRVPVLSVETPEGKAYLEPVARYVSRGTGSVELYAWPSLNRVRLIRGQDKVGWRVLTDSGIYLRQNWNAETFADLVTDLISAP
jgi:hypothetical protein